MNEQSFNDYKHSITDKNKKLVHGFVRQSQSSLSTEHSSLESSLFTTIPNEIYEIVLLYYLVGDKWNEKYIFDNYKISGIDNEILTKLNNGHKSMFLSEIVGPKGKHIWKYKIIKHGGLYGRFGVVLNRLIEDKQLWATHLCTIPNTCYVWECMIGNELLMHEYDRWSGIKYGVKCVKNDIVSVILDCNKNELSYAVNGNHYGKAFDVRPNEQYRGCAYFRSVGTQAQLLLFTSEM